MSDTSPAPRCSDGSDLSLHVITVAWNEEAFLPYFLRHYSSLGARITVFDNESDDHTAEIARQWPNTEVRTFGTGGQLQDAVNSHLKSTAWCEGRPADWVICVDADEIIHHADLRRYLAGCDARGVGVVVPAGYDMVPAQRRAEYLDEPVTEFCSRGAYNALYSKPVMFSGRRIREVVFGPGAHAARFDPVPVIEGDIGGDLCARENFPPTLSLDRLPSPTGTDVKLLHYRFFDPASIADRWSILDTRRSELNRSHNFGAHYEIPGTVREEYVRWVCENSTDLTTCP